MVQVSSRKTAFCILLLRTAFWILLTSNQHLNQFWIGFTSFRSGHSLSGIGSQWIPGYLGFNLGTVGVLSIHCFETSFTSQHFMAPYGSISNSNAAGKPFPTFLLEKVGMLNSACSPAEFQKLYRLFGRTQHISMNQTEMSQTSIFNLFTL